MELWVLVYQHNINKIIILSAVVQLSVVHCGVLQYGVVRCSVVCCSVDEAVALQCGDDVVQCAVVILWCCVCVAVDNYKYWD
jgi:hypothetical protein